MAILTVLLVVVAAVIAIPLIAITRRKGAGDDDSPAVVITYLILVIASAVATSSFSSLVESILPGDVRIFDDPSDVALTLATLIVAGLVWGSVWVALERRRQGPSTGRSLYLSVTAAVALTVVAYTGVRLLALAFGVDDYEPSVVADALSFGALWIVVEWWRRGDAELEVLRNAWGSLVGLGLAASGLGIILYRSLQTVVGEAGLLIEDGDLSEGLRGGLTVLLVGAAYFVFFWLRRFSRQDGALRNWYAAAISILAWFVTFHALGFLLFELIEPLFGFADGRPLRELPGALATVLVGGLGYWHHRSFLGNERIEMVRALEYLFGAYSLAFFAGSFSFLLTQIVIRALATQPVLSDSGEVLVGTLIALALSGATTFRYWGRALQLGEPQSPSRRAALLILFFGSALTGAFALIFVLFTLLRTVLAGGGEDLAEPLAWAVPIILVSGVVCWHTVALRRQLGPARAAVDSAPDAARPVVAAEKVVTLVASDPGPLPALIKGMRFLRRADGVGAIGEDTAPEIVAAINASPGRAVLVTVTAEGYSVVPLA